MRTFCKWAVALVLPVVWTATAWAQEEDLLRETTVKLILLRQKSVQKELELSDEVIKKIMDFTTVESVAAGKALKLDPDKRKEALDRLEGLNKKFLADNLNEKQSKRLHQIMLQITALEQLTKPEVAEKLKLTEEQQQKLKDLRQEDHKELLDILTTKGGQGKKERLARLRERMREKILAVLTDEQKKLVKEKVGEPFKGELEYEEHQEDKDR